MYVFNHGYGVCFRKILERPQSYIRCTFRCQKMCAREIFPKFIRMPQMCVCDKCYNFFLGGGGSNELKRVQRGIK